MCDEDFHDYYRSASGLSGALQEHTDGYGCLSSMSTVRQLWIHSKSQCHFINILHTVAKDTFIWFVLDMLFLLT